MQLTVQIPDDIESNPSSARAALEAFAIEGYRSGVLSTRQTRQMLGFETSLQLDGFLKKNQVWERSYSVADFEKDTASFERHE